MPYYYYIYNSSSSSQFNPQSLSSSMIRKSLVKKKPVTQWDLQVLQSVYAGQKKDDELVLERKLKMKEYVKELQQQSSAKNAKLKELLEEKKYDGEQLQSKVIESAQTDQQSIEKKRKERLSYGESLKEDITQRQQNRQNQLLQRFYAVRNDNQFGKLLGRAQVDIDKKRAAQRKLRDDLQRLVELKERMAKEQKLTERQLDEEALIQIGKDMDQRLSSQKQQQRMINDRQEGLESYFKDPRVLNYTRAEKIKTQLINEKAERKASDVRQELQTIEAQRLDHRRQMIKEMINANKDITKTIVPQKSLNLEVSKASNMSTYNPQKQVLIDDYLRYQHSKEHKQAQQATLRASLERQMREKEELHSIHEGVAQDPFKLSYTQRQLLSNSLNTKGQSAMTERRSNGGSLQAEFVKLQTLIHESQKIEKNSPFKRQSQILLA